ncbi:MAG: AI-2E family transporter [Pirellulales bacterium]
MTLPPEARIQSRIFTLLCGVVIVAALYFARGILLPFALAILLSFLLAPIVNRLEDWRLGRIPAVVIAVGIAFTSIAILGYVMAVQFYDLADQLPNHKNRILEKAETFQSSGEGVMARLSATFHEVQAKLLENDEESQPDAGELLDEAAGANAPSMAASGEEQSLSESLEELAEKGQPVPVELVNRLSAGEVAQNVLGPVLAPLGTLVIVIVFVIFILIEREDLRNRFVYLVGAKQLSNTTQAIDDAAYRVSRYLLMQLIINSIYGLVIAIGLFLIGLPNALLWGFLATVMRFVPYVGPWIAAIFPVALSLAVFEGWTRPLMVAGLFVVNELISNNVFEPWLYGSSTGISTIGIIISAVFWTWLWGPVGLVLATPLTVCLSVIGRYVPQFAFINTLLSDDEVLPAHLRLYQRLLAMDPEEGYDVAEEHFKANSLVSLYDTVILPALRLAEHDRHQGMLDESKERFVLQAVRDMVEEFGSQASAASPNGDGVKVVDKTASAPTAKILCVPARDEADELAGMMLAQLLALRGFDAEVLSTKSLASEAVQEVRDHQASVVCVSALPPFAATHARYITKRLRPHFPDLRIVVGLWQTNAHSKKAEERLLAAGVDRFVTALADAVEYMVQIAASAHVREADNEAEQVVASSSSVQRAALPQERVNR